MGLATPTSEPLTGVNDGGTNGGCPTNGVGSWPAGVPSGIAAGGADGLAGAGAAKGSTTAGSAGGGGTAGSPGKPNGAGGGGGSSCAGGPSTTPGSGLTSGSAHADGALTPNPTTNPAAKIAAITLFVFRCGIRHLQCKIASSVAQHDPWLTPAKPCTIAGRRRQTALTCTYRRDSAVKCYLRTTTSENAVTQFSVARGARAPNAIP